MAEIMAGAVGVGVSDVAASVTVMMIRASLEGMVEEGRDEAEEEDVIEARAVAGTEAGAVELN